MRTDINIAPAATISNPHIAQWVPRKDTIEAVLSVIEQCLYLDGPESQFEEKGRNSLRTTVSQIIQRQARIELVFPGFPFKSPSLNKVLGILPDFADELLLRRLELLARSIQDIYAPGAVIRIVSDGVVYGAILGQTDFTVYQYNAELRRICKDAGLTNLSFVRLIDLFDPPESPLASIDQTQSEYLQTATEARRKLTELPVPGWNLEDRLKTDYGVLMTYRGYLKFLISDLENCDLLKTSDGNPLPRSRAEKVRKVIARQMLECGARFSLLVERRFPRAVRLSCHPHDQSGPKFGIRLFPGHGVNVSPWHNTIFEKADGSLTIGSYESFRSIDHVVVERYGRPYFLREASPATDLGEHINPHVSFERNFPFGMIIVADKAANLSLHDLPMDKIRVLTNLYSALLLRGFASVDQAVFREKCDEMGQVIEWPKFGAILELKENPDLDMNSSLTCESMPMHYDGVFKTKTLPDGSKTHDFPKYQVFQCIKATEGSEGGQTLLTNTDYVLRFGLTNAERDWLKNKTYSVFTPLNQVFGGDLLKLPIIMQNEETSHDIIRWHEDWPQYVTKYKHADVFINDATPEESSSMGNRLTSLLYDRRFCYAHTWAEGDYLFADNVEMMHTRTAFKPCPRELWRIHVN
ncbi:Pyoverdine/dityrosine biosynthesis protein-domain-containing protein [Flagelloscypha sp. PMI_526]|nr:Pyoverdine/dityrosine biosynthesis protein-domain-containing protein [Flagelloscypha sp. PMI_526]